MPSCSIPALNWLTIFNSLKVRYSQHLLHVDPPILDFPFCFGLPLMRLANQSLNRGCRRGMTAGLQPKRKGTWRKMMVLAKRKDVLEPERFANKARLLYWSCRSLRACTEEVLSLCLHQVFRAGKRQSLLEGWGGFWQLGA
jgi:hypothetical protein